MKQTKRDTKQNRFADFDSNSRPLPATTPAELQFSTKKTRKYTVGITTVEPNGTTLDLKYLLSRAGDVLRNDNAGYRCQWARPSFSRVIFVNSFKSYQVPGSILATTGILL